MSELNAPEPPVNGGLLAGVPSEVPGKRQRRPSVRLGDIGDQPSTLSYEAYKRNRQWNRDYTFRHFSHKETGAVGSRSSKTRTLTNFINGVDHVDSLEGTLDVKRDSKGKRGTKRVRSNWVRKIDEGAERAERDEKLSGGEGEDGVGVEDAVEWYKGFDAVEGSESPNQIRVRVSESRGDQGGVELENDGRDWNCGTSVDKNNGVSDKERSGYLEDGVRMWLNGLGLGRYEPVFEIHEVDEEVLPLLTLEDLKDMGINAVGSRRKLFRAIQKLSKGF